MRILSVLSASHENTRNATTHGDSLLTWISDAGSTPAASTNIFQPFTGVLQESNEKRTLDSAQVLIPSLSFLLPDTILRAIPTLFTRALLECPANHGRCEVNILVKVLGTSREPVTA